MSANPPKHDAWPQPRHWRHVWVRFDRSNTAPLPGLVLDWRRKGTRWSAWVVWLDTRYPRPKTEQGWIDAQHLRPARSDINIWNDGRWR